MPNNRTLDLGDVSEVKQLALIGSVFYDIAGDFVVQLDGEIIPMQRALASDRFSN